MADILLAIYLATGGMFDWTLLDNWNQRKVVQRPKKLGCSTQVMFNRKLKIFEHKFNQTKLGRWLCSINSYVDFDYWTLAVVPSVAWDF